MNRRKGIIKITLNSDLCVGSGYTYAGIIDCDVCYNENGIPYIPGRRLKGCLREAGELIRVGNLDRIFGSSGSNEICGIMLGNAYPMPVKEYEALNDELTSLKENNSIYAPYLTQQKVLEYYTRVKAQTSINRETGVAKDTSLRYTRVINQYPDGTDKPLSFYSEVEFDCEEDTLCRIVKALRHIGLNRTRGLGNVSCRLEQTESIKADRSAVTGNVQGDGDYIRLDYVIRNEQPLMLSGENDGCTDSYVSGTSVLGALAAAYLSQEGHTAEDGLFQDMFLKGEVIFSNLTPTLYDHDRERFESYMPAPLFINRLKKTRRLVNLVGARDSAADNNAEYDLNNGNQPKHLKTQYVSFGSGNCTQAAVTEPMVDIVYHHSKRQSSASGEEGILYSLEVLKEGQFFKGSIYAKKQYIDELALLVSKDCRLRFGKSKSAQYGACRIVEWKESVPEPIRIKAGERIFVVLASDGIFCDENGYTARYETVKRELPKSLGIKAEDGAGNDGLAYGEAGMAATVVTGYHAMWNLKKPSLPAVKAGSFFEYTAVEDCEIERPFAGEKNLEGFGQVMIYKADGMTYAVEERKSLTAKAGAAKEPDKSRQLLKAVLAQELREYLKGAVWNEAVSTNLRLSASTLGRITLMLKESLNQDGEQTYKKYKERIESIKRKTVRDEAMRLLERLDGDKLVALCRKDEIYDMIVTMCGTNDEADKLIMSMWGESMMNMLVYYKYQKSRTKSSQRQ